MIYKIIIDKQSSANPSNEKREYTIDIEELRVKGDIYDSLVITKDEDYVMRRLSLSELQVLTVLEEPIKQTIPNLNVELFEGDNYIYLLDMTGNKFYAEYIVKNDFTDTYVTTNMMTSAVNQSAKEIELSVNQKLTGYSTTEEMNALINMKADEINQQVEKKVNEETITGAYLILKINGDISEAKLNADKIELSANDILNLLAGNTINLSSQNITISSDHFNVDANGNMKIIDDIADSNDWNFSVESTDRLKRLAMKPFFFNIKNNSTNSAFGINIASVAGYELTNGIVKIRNIASNESAYTNWSNGINSTNVSESGISTPILEQTSLEEKKKNFERLKSGLEILKNIDIYKYNLKSEEDNTKKHIGFVIGDDYNYSKEITSNNNDGVDIYSFASVCCKAIQEQQEQIENQNDLIQSLIERIENLEKGANNEEN